MSGEVDAHGAHAVVVAAIAERRAARTVRRSVSAELTFREVMGRAADRGDEVTVRTLGGAELRLGGLAPVGATSEVVVGCTASSIEVVGLDAVRTVVVHRARRLPPRGGIPRSGGRVGEAMASILADREAGVRVTIRIAGEVVRGRLVAVGDDVVSVRPGGAGEDVYVRLDSTTEVSVSLSSSP